MKPFLSCSDCLKDCGGRTLIGTGLRWREPRYYPILFQIKEGEHDVVRKPLRLFGIIFLIDRVGNRAILRFPRMA
ncbi:hypothetical protein GFL39_16690 [Rhizobium leguminosarum bv. viciae]|nr:hypothetical protein [Rhizobium leguminosarum bv. viciae]NKL06546.1 hypothetical protein [Rhizobium leguminosarum bv. viciae]NKL84689.1 hypothetical protein [Rhizobium leguminosarum bv. viciae]NKM91952.1 hypothetical protein [Rhizobium leguminosarum bv. viciae]